MNGRSVKVTQIAFPEDVTAAVYSTGVYASSGQNPTTNARDGIFAEQPVGRDGDAGGRSE
jgi:hypothetical protein